MTWRYQMTHRTVKWPSGQVEEAFEVREVYDFKDSGCLSWTDDAIAPESDTRDGLVDVLQMMLKDVQQFDVLEVGE